MLYWRHILLALGRGRLLQKVKDKSVEGRIKLLHKYWQDFLQGGQGLSVHEMLELSIRSSKSNSCIESLSNYLFLNFSFS